MERGCRRLSLAYLAPGPSSSRVLGSRLHLGLRCRLDQWRRRRLFVHTIMDCDIFRLALRQAKIGRCPLRSSQIAPGATGNSRAHYHPGPDGTCARIRGRRLDRCSVFWSGASILLDSPLLRLAPCGSAPALPELIERLGGPIACGTKATRATSCSRVARVHRWNWFSLVPNVVDRVRADQSQLRQGKESP